MIKSNGAHGFPIYDFLIVFNEIQAFKRNFQCDISNSLKINSIGSFGLPCTTAYYCLIVTNCLSTFSCYTCR